MDGALEVALVGAAVALTSAAIGIHSVRVAHGLDEQRDARSREQVGAELMKKYRDPLLHSAFDLQSRLFNILQLDFMGKWYVHGTDFEREYAVENTLHVIGEYLGWVEILRLEVRFLDLHDVELNRQLARKIEGVSEVFLANDVDSVLRIFRGEQRAIGEVMTSGGAGSAGERGCLGYASFLAKKDEPAFDRWFAKLRQDIDALATEPGEHSQRLVLLQRSLIDLIRFLDPDRVHFPQDLSMLGTSNESDGAVTPSP